MEAKEGVGIFPTIRKEKSLYLFFIGTLFLLPSFGSQFFAGITVNAILFLSASNYGMKKTLFLCLIPSISALVFGVLPSSFVYLVPFIMISNIGAAWLFSRMAGWKRILFPGLVKAFFLGGAYLSISGMFFLDPIWQTILALQAGTALIGGIVAHLMLYLKKRNS